jgi:hypothetical protein
LAQEQVLERVLEAQQQRQERAQAVVLRAPQASLLRQM